MSNFNKYIKEVTKVERKTREEIEKETLETFFRSTLKPKPRWIPGWLWLKGAKIFLNI